MSLRNFKKIDELAQSPATIVSTLTTGAAMDANVVDYRELNKPRTKDKINQENEEFTKFDLAKRILYGMLRDDDFNRRECIDLLKKRLNVTETTAVTYYQRIAKMMHKTNLKHDTGVYKNPYDKDGDGHADDLNYRKKQDKAHARAMIGSSYLDGYGYPSMQKINRPQEEKEEVEVDPNSKRQGVIRYIDNAHLVYKIKNAKGLFDELWIYNCDHASNDELDIKRAILAGTDIEAKNKKSADGTQEYEITTMGNAQLLFITGLPQ